MEIEYYVDKDDIIEFNLYHLDNSKYQQRIAKITNNVVMVLIGLIGTSIFIYYGGWFFGLSCGVIYTILNILLERNKVYKVSDSKFQRNQVRKAVESMLSEGKNREVIGKQRLTVDDKGIGEITSVSSSFSTWEGIEKVVQNEKYIFIYKSSNNAYIIPKSTFVNPLQEKEFFQTVQNYHNNYLSHSNVNYFSNS